MDGILEILTLIGVISYVVYKGSRETRKQVDTGQMPDLDFDDLDEVQATTVSQPISSPTKPVSETSSPKRTRKTNRIAAPTPTQEEPTGNDQEFNIQSAEEVRRAIIWSEILNRKY